MSLHGVPPLSFDFWIVRRICGCIGQARLRLDRRVLPPTFAITSPRLVEGEVMAKAGGNRRVCANANGG